MFNFKSKEFYTNYFNNLEDFELVEEFDQSKDHYEKNLYVGIIKAKKCIHPLTIRVEIPTTFPYNKLTFRTKSLSGYPHLIHTGKIKYGDWFCLNTPFGETAENQLELEMGRLREWMRRQLREDLPAKIKDLRFAAALRRANAYEWENEDEINEFRKDAELTIIGNLACEIPNDNNLGFLHCIKKNNLFYAVRNKCIANFELPYVFVDNLPSDLTLLDDVIALSKYYNWSEDVMKHILPEINLKYEWQPSKARRNKYEKRPIGHHATGKGIRNGVLEGKDLYDFPAKLNPSLAEENCMLVTKNFDEDEALRLLAEVKHSLAEKDCKLKVKVAEKESLRFINDEKKSIILKQIDEFIKEVKTNHGYGPNYYHIKENRISISEIENGQLTPEQEAQLAEEAKFEQFQYGHHSFALGVRQKEDIKWYFCCTNRISVDYEKEEIDIGICWAVIERPYACSMSISSAQTIEEKQFFGRGVFSDSLRSRKVAIVGLGAIGSMVAESLARSGVTAIGLWDNDVVEPGNICRSTFRAQDIGENKGIAIKKHLAEINPFINIDEIKAAGAWTGSIDDIRYEGGSFYDDINYGSQSAAISKIASYDLIIDCTGSNELLHFISYAVPDKQIVSLCITNHAKNLLMLSSNDGNPFELHKAYLSKIEQDTKNFYLEGTGCYNPTFIATNSDITALVNIAISRLNDDIASKHLHSVILSYDKRGVIADQLERYELKGHDISMIISSETLMDGEDIPEAENGILGFVFGCYSNDGKQIMVTHIVPADFAHEQLENAFKTSKGIIDYIGDFVYSGSKANTFTEEAFTIIESKALNQNINTNNPLLAVRNPEGSLSFFLYINGDLIPFKSTLA